MHLGTLLVRIMVVVTVRKNPFTVTVIGSTALLQLKTSLVDAVHGRVHLSVRVVAGVVGGVLISYENLYVGIAIILFLLGEN